MIKNEFLSKGESTAPGIKTFEERGGGGGALSSSTCGTNRITRNVFYSLLCQTFLHKTITCFVLNPKADNFNVSMYSGCGG